MCTEETYELCYNKSLFLFVCSVSYTVPQQWFCTKQHDNLFIIIIIIITPLFTAAYNMISDLISTNLTSGLPFITVHCELIVAKPSAIDSFTIDRTLFSLVTAEQSPNLTLSVTPIVSMFALTPHM